MTDPDARSLAESLEAKAAARRADGTYPPDIDAALEADVDRRLRAVATHTSALRAALSQLRSLGGFEVPTYRGTNRLKALYAKVVDRAIGHALADLVRQLEAHRLAVERVLEVLADEAEPPDGHDHG